MTEKEAPPEGYVFAMHGHAKRLRHRFPMVSHEDIVQEQLVWWYSHPRKVAQYLEQSVEDELAGRKLSRALRNAGLAYCHREKARTVGYEIDDLYFYSVALLREILPAVYDEEAWRRIGRAEVNDMPKGKSVPSEGNNVVTCLIDVKNAVAKLPADLLQLIVWQFRDGLEDEQVASRLHTSKDGARMRVQRALRRLQDELGGERPDWAAASHGE